MDLMSVAVVARPGLSREFRYRVLANSLDSYKSDLTSVGTLRVVTGDTPVHRNETSLVPPERQPRRPGLPDAPEDRVRLEPTGNRGSRSVPRRLWALGLPLSPKPSWRITRPLL